MPNFSSWLTLATAAALVGSAAGVISDKPAVFSSSDEWNRQDPDLNKELAQKTFTSAAWGEGWIPQYCYSEANTYGLNPADFEVRNVKFSDCSGSWAVCRHKNSPETWTTIQTQLGKLPVGGRQYIRNIVVMPNGVQTGVCGWVIAWSQCITFNPGCLTPGVMFHELNHILDAAALPDVTPSGMFYSDTSHWQGAYAKDPSIPTDYARNSWHENFAEAARWTLSNIIHPGGLAAYNSEWSKIANVVGNYASRMEDILFPASGKCSFKADTTPAVRMDGSVAKTAPPPSSLEGSDLSDFIPPAGIPKIRFVYPRPNATLLNYHVD